MIILQSPFLTAVWDPVEGGLVSVVDAATGADVGTGPGPMVAVMARDRETGVGGYLRLTACRLEDGGRTVVCEGEAPAAGKHRGFRIRDRWTLSATEPRLRLERRVVPLDKWTAADFAPLVLRLNPRLFTEVLPLGVGKQDKTGKPRGWLESWYSKGWYLALEGSPAHPGEAVALLVRPRPNRNGSSGLSRFRYGFFPADELPGFGAALPDDELQVRLRGPRLLRGENDAIELDVDIYLLAGYPWTAAGALALRNATPATLREHCRLGRKETWKDCAGVQTLVPEAPRYMFRVRDPLPNVGFYGERP